MRYLFFLILMVTVACAEFVAVCKDPSAGKDAVRAYGASLLSEKKALEICQKNSHGYTCNLVPNDYEIIIYRRSDNQGRLGMAWEPVKPPPTGVDAAGISMPMQQTATDYLAAGQDTQPKTADEIARADCEVLLDQAEKDVGISCNPIQTFLTPKSNEPAPELALRNQREEQAFFVVIAKEKASRAYGASQTNLSMARSLCQKFSSGADCNLVPQGSYVTITQRSDHMGRLGIGIAKEKGPTDFDAQTKSGEEARKDCEAQLTPDMEYVTCNPIMQYYTKE